MSEAATAYSSRWFPTLLAFGFVVYGGEAVMDGSVDLGVWIGAFNTLREFSTTASSIYSSIVAIIEVGRGRACGGRACSVVASTLAEERAGRCSDRHSRGLHRFRQHLLSSDGASRVGRVVIELVASSRRRTLRHVGTSEVWWRLNHCVESVTVDFCVCFFHFSRALRAPRTRNWRPEGHA